MGRGAKRWIKAPGKWGEDRECSEGTLLAAHWKEMEESGKWLAGLRRRVE
jgi:hypothetical protein